MNASQNHGQTEYSTNQRKRKLSKNRHTVSRDLGCRHFRCLYEVTTPWPRKFVSYVFSAAIS